MKISIITPTFNSEKTIAETITSVLSQENVSVEHIIIDGNSADNTLSIVQSFPHLKKVVSEPDKGLYDAMNKGIQRATGDVVGILNSDDVYAHSNVLATVEQVFLTDNIGAAYGDLVYVHAEDSSKVVRDWKAGIFSLEKFRFGWMPPHPTFFLRRNFYEQYGNYSLTLKNSSDYELMLRILYKHGVSVQYIPEILVHMRVGGHSNNSLKSRIRANFEDRKAWYMNGLKPAFYTTLLKPIRKLHQIKHFR